MRIIVSYRAYFSAYEMNSPAVTEEGKSKIRGYLNKEEDVEFTTFPLYHKLQCALPKSKPDNIYITCLIDHPIHSSIFIEQQAIRKGWK